MCSNLMFMKNTHPFLFSLFVENLVIYPSVLLSSLLYPADITKM